MAEASRIILCGFELRTEARLVRYPDHYSDKRGERMWREVMAGPYGERSNAKSTMRHEDSPSVQAQSVRSRETSLKELRD